MVILSLNVGRLSAFQSISFNRRMRLIACAHNNVFFLCLISHREKCSQIVTIFQNKCITNDLLLLLLFPNCLWYASKTIYLVECVSKRHKKNRNENLPTKEWTNFQLLEMFSIALNVLNHNWITHFRNRLPILSCRTVIFWRWTWMKQKKKKWKVKTKTISFFFFFSFHKLQIKSFRGSENDLFEFTFVYIGQK